MVAALIGSRVAAFELGVVHEVFGLDRAECDDRPYDLRVVAAYGSPVPVNIYSSGGKPTSSVGSWSISTPWDIDSLDEADTLVIVTWPDPELPTPPAEIGRAHV